MWINENHVSVICGLGNEYESDVQGSSENKAGFQFLTGLIFFCQALFSLMFIYQIALYINDYHILSIIDYA